MLQEFRSGIDHCGLTKPEGSVEEFEQLLEEWVEFGLMENRRKIILPFPFTRIPCVEFRKSRVSIMLILGKNQQLTMWENFNEPEKTS